MFAISRITKDPQVRQAELMDTAAELFLTRGYQKTTVQDIVRKVNVAQGTFYYYFASKEAILEAIFSRHVKKMLAEVQSISLPNASGLTKLQLFINLFFKLSYYDELGLMGAILYKENQGALINKLWRQTHLLANPLLVRIIEQANQEGLTNVIHVNETLGFFSGIMGSLLEAISPLEFGHESDPAIMNNKLTIAEQLMETLFVAPVGSIHLLPTDANRPR